MCSIFAILDIRGDDAAALRPLALEASRCMRHRGPDWSGVHVDDGAVLVHERLAIVGLDSGAQPLYSPDRRHVLAVNGEIYNHRALRASLEHAYDFATHSDCEVVLPLYRDGPDPEAIAAWLNRLEGMFAFVLWDSMERRWLIARDPVGIVPLYWGRDADGCLHVASEMKGLAERCEHVEEFPPGHFWTDADPAPRRYWTPRWRDYATVAGAGAGRDAIRHALEEAVRSHLMCDVPYGVLLSGGLDSSLVAAIAKKYAARRIEDDSRSEAWWPQLHSFAIGLPGSPDLAAAAQVAAHIGTVHHGIEFSVQEGLDALPEVIRHLETYDVTTVRASTPMYLMARRIRAMGIKMVLSGEGSDELFGGYLYFHKAPDARALHEETVRKLDALHLFDCLRANKSMAAWGVEARVPFLDRGFVDAAMSLDPEVKLSGRARGRIEKQFLREAFAGYLPDPILWRQKEQFSDGVGYSWIDSLRAHAEAAVGDADLAAAAERFPHNTPQTREAYLYRDLFHRHYPQDWAAKLVPGGPSVACSTAAALEWDPSLKTHLDPSGRAVAAVHNAAY
ncbi:asparagine synthase B [Coralloluteibacterium stylophorae]|uniref:asparagine synthase (glutamine-hydrolyzing) n=1 Tax=Coralloluteibacterium stylophorae TaxID=1776034 RepID=A0A8J8AWI7_9GAMM|nr:asparagine synthase B [Coralloluteibacterium stylophorae]MBS7456196.1 asparagine synthase B [Coralloluteibacterium stylophorae]